MTLGLKRDQVTLTECYADAVLDFAAARAEAIAAGIPFEDMQHVGSTAVEDLPAKPIVDIAVRVLRAEDIGRVVAGLVALGYTDEGFRDDAGGQILSYSRDGVVIRHVHVVDNDAQWSGYLVLRDLLRSSLWARQRYLEVKVDLAITYSNDRRRYTSAKAALIGELLEYAQRGIPTNGSTDA